MTDKQISNERRQYEYKSVYTNIDDTNKITENLHKQIVIDGVDVSGYEWYSSTYFKPCDGCKKTPNCYYKQLKRKEQEYEELIKYHNKCCEEFEKEKKEWLEKYDQISRGFYNGDYCNTEHCSLLKAKEQECEELKKQACGLRPELKYIIDKTCSKYNIEVKTYHEKIVEIIHRLNRYNQTLIEIKEIAKKIEKFL